VKAERIAGPMSVLLSATAPKSRTLQIVDFEESGVDGPTDLMSTSALARLKKRNADTRSAVKMLENMADKHKFQLLLTSFMV
jgi:hypothetical protein